MKKILNTLYVLLVVGIIAEMSMVKEPTDMLLLLRIGLCLVGVAVVVLTTIIIFQKTTSKTHRTACLITDVVYLAALVLSRFLPQGVLQISIMTVWVASMLVLNYLIDDRRFAPDFVLGEGFDFVNEGSPAVAPAAEITEGETAETDDAAE